MSPRTSLFTTLIVTLTMAVPLGMGVGAIDPAGPQILADPGDTADGTPVSPKEGCDALSPAAVLASTTYEEVFAHYEDVPGFLDLHYVADAESAYLLVLFDPQVRPAATLPSPVPTASGLEVRVAAPDVAPLLAPLPATYMGDLEQETSSEGFPTTSCGGRISPGARIATPVGYCSLNFLYTDQYDRWYAGSAGHCFSATGQTARVAGIGTIGTAVYRVASGVGSDFALIRIDPEDVDQVDPSMCHWGGPTNVGADGRDLVRHYGHGVIYDMSAATRARTGMTYSIGTYSFTFAGTVTSGDSGSGARLDGGAALGTITHVMGAGTGGVVHSTPLAYGTTAEHGMAMAEAATGLDLTLRTAPLA